MISEKRVVRASGQTLRSPERGLTGASAGSTRHSLRLKDRFALTHRYIFFRAGSWDYINIRPPHKAQFFSLFRSVRLPSLLAFMRTTSIIGGPCYRQAPLAADFFSGWSSIDGDRSPVRFFYLPPSIGLLLTVRTRFFSVRTITYEKASSLLSIGSLEQFWNTPSRSSYERAYWLEVFTSVFFMFVGCAWFALS